MSRYEHGRILAVNETTLGSELVGAHAAGVGSLTVEDPVDFDEDGGWLKIADQVVEYSTYDDDTGEITLKGTLDAAAGEGDRVDLWDELRQVVTVDKIAQVELDGDDDNTDPLEATIPLHLLDDMPEGIRGLRGESVLLEQDGDEWRIVDVLGLGAPTAGGGATKFWDDDVHTVAAAGDQTATLTHTPLDGSLHMRWNELPQEPTEYTVAGRTVTVPDPGGLLLPGDRLWFMYAYNAAQSAIDDQPPAPEVPWWDGDPAQGSPWGYPTSYMLWEGWHREDDPTSADWDVMADLGLQITDQAAADTPNMLRVYLVWQYSDPGSVPDPDGKGEADDNPQGAIWGAYRFDEPIPVTCGGVEHNVSVGHTIPSGLTETQKLMNYALTARADVASRESLYTSIPTYEAMKELVAQAGTIVPVGIQIVYGILDADKHLGTTHGPTGRFYLGTPIPRSIHPDDYPDATTEPYL